MTIWNCLVLMEDLYVEHATLSTQHYIIANHKKLYGMLYDVGGFMSDIQRFIKHCTSVE